jgi:predicted GNAT family acetyltransferase
VSEAPEIVDNVAKSRFETVVDGRLAELVYRRDGDRLVLIHVGVPDAIGGRGIGAMLVTAAIDEAERDGRTVVPSCPFARHWLRHHPDAAARVVVDWSRGPN